jgi:hypothetical protein
MAVDTSIDKPKHYNWGLTSGWKCGDCPESVYARFEREGEFPQPCRDWEYTGLPYFDCERVVHDSCGFVFCLRHGGARMARRS